MSLLSPWHDHMLTIAPPPPAIWPAGRGAAPSADWSPWSHPRPPGPGRGSRGGAGSDACRSRCSPTGQPPKCHPRLEQRCHRLRIGDAHGRGQPRGPLRPRSARCRRWPLSHQCGPPPLCRPRPRWRGRCLADPGASAGHHGRLAFKPCHRVLLDCVVLSRHAARPQPEKAQDQRSRARHRQRRFR